VLGGWRLRKAGAEVKDLKARGYQPVLTRTRWLLLKRPENLTESQEGKLTELLRYNLRSVRSYLLKEDSSSSGSMCPQPGPAASWTAGARRSCAHGLSR
jgi:transposase